MPHFTLNFTTGGPVIDVFIAVSQARAQALQKVGKPIPNPVQARALIDTGASCTCVDHVIVSTLGISPTGSVPVHTPSTASKTPHQANQYDAVILIPCGTGLTPFISGTMPVLDAALAHQGIQALIGRDILSRCLFVFDGRTGIFTLAF